MIISVSAILFAFLFFSFINPVFAQGENQIIVFQTPLGHLAIELFPEDAPNHVEKVLDLAELGFYDGTTFHRVIKNFMIQGGAPNTEANNIDPGDSLMAEFNSIKHERGIVSAARTNDPNSARTQFFIIHKNSNFLNEKYTAFGRLVTQESYDTLDKIASLPTSSDRPLDIEQTRILKTEILNRDEITNLLDLSDPARTKPKIVPPETKPQTTESQIKGPTSDKPETFQSEEKTNELSSTKEGGGCLIATATYDSELSPQVQQLRELRDNNLLKTKSGSEFIETFNQFYYSFSPTIADWERQNSIFKETVKLTITPLLSSLSILNYVNMDSESEVLGYGLGVILLNVGMYFVAPAIFIYKIRNFTKSH